MDINKRLSVHHVGGRSGSRGFPMNSKFEQDIINVLYDADPDCIEQIRESKQSLESELHVLPYCLGEDSKSSTFNINYDPYTSSLREVNNVYKPYYYYNGCVDYIISDVMHTREKIKVDIVSMDHLFQSKMVSVPPPDFLSLDTQGSEYEILLGAKNILESSCLALQVEAAFHPIYKGQKLFGDICKLLSDHGFLFIKFADILRLSPYRAPIGQRDEGFDASTDAIFIKDVEYLKLEDECQRYIMLNKLAFISIIFHQFEYGLKCLNYAKNIIIDEDTKQELESVTYYQFLRDMEEQLKSMQKIFSKTFCQNMTFQESKARFQSKNETKQEKRFLLFCMLIKLRRIKYKCKWLLKYYYIYFLCRYPLVKIMEGYGLREHAKRLKRKRALYFANACKIKQILFMK